VRPAPFDYVAPRTVEETLEILARHGDEAKLLAGGQSLVPMMNMRLVRPAVLVDLNRVAALGTLKDRGRITAEARVVIMLTGAGIKYEAPELPSPHDLSGGPEDVHAQVIAALTRP